YHAAPRTLPVRTLHAAPCTLNIWDVSSPRPALEFGDAQAFVAPARGGGLRRDFDRALRAVTRAAGTRQDCREMGRHDAAQVDPRGQGGSDAGLVLALDVPEHRLAGVRRSRAHDARLPHRRLSPVRGCGEIGRAHA